MRSIEQTRSLFARNYYHWAASLLQRELGSGFQWLRLFEDAGAKSFLTITTALSTEQCRSMAWALLRNRHAQALADGGESRDPSENQLLELYNSMLRECLAVNRSRSIAEGPFDIKSLPRRRIRNLVLEYLGERFGRAAKCDVPGYRKVEREFGGVLIETYFDTVAPYSALGYWHQIRSQESEGVAQFISVLGWFGISGTTEWKTVTDANINRVLEALESACQTFHAGLPELCSGLI